MVLDVKCIYLASHSPRRRELLKQIGVNFEVVQFREFLARGPDVDEAPLAGEPPENYVKRIACAKTEAGWSCLVQRRLRRFPVLAADTTVVLDGKIIGKPVSRDHVVAMLSELSGREHSVLTAVALKFEDKTDLGLSTTLVRFKQLAEEEVRHYAATGEALDKAGGYAIQGLAAAFVAGIDGSYSGVMGLPLFETAQLLREFGYGVL
ncbi:MAG TPA: Maf family protein [Burkholderiales bacterium]|nr:Maf family protein [Burkholderiales bacterium]